MLMFVLLQVTRQLSSAPKGHLSRTPGSPVAERRGNQEFAAQLPRSPRSEAEGRTMLLSDKTSVAEIDFFVK